MWENVYEFILSKCAIACVSMYVQKACVCNTYLQWGAVRSGDVMEEVNVKHKKIGSHARCKEGNWREGERERERESERERERERERRVERRERMCVSARLCVYLGCELDWPMGDPPPTMGLSLSGNMCAIKKRTTFKKKEENEIIIQRKKWEKNKLSSHIP